MVKADSSAETLVLASASPTRAKMLRAAGLRFEVRPAAVDEEAVRAALGGEDAAVAAAALAALKAERVSAQRPESVVIGADQLLCCEGKWFDKTTDRAGADAQLRALQGRRHELVTAVCVLRDGARLWSHVARPVLTMRALDDAAVERYLESAGDEAFGSVGGYRMEGIGAQLFDAVEGDWFAILGLPLIPLLCFLRSARVLAS